MTPIRLQILAAALIASGTVHAATIAGFGDGTGFTLNKNANGVDSSITDGTLTLTTATTNQARSVFANDKQDITSFTTTFRYQNGSPGGGADGFVFTVQNAGINALGSSGGSRGYRTDGGGTQNVGSSVNVAFNIFNSDATSVGSNGAFGNLLASANTVPTNLLNLADIAISYDGTTLSFTVTNPNDVTQTISRNVNVDIASIVGADTAFIGFTGGTGGTSAVQTLSNFNFTSPIPEPSTAVLGFLGAGLLIRRKR